MAAQKIGGELSKVGGELSKKECQIISDVLGDNYLPKGCDALIAPEDPFEGKDETHHRNSWLWPKFARRRTKKADGEFHQYHPTNWDKPTVDEKQCKAIEEAMKKMMDHAEAMEKMPSVCK